MTVRPPALAAVALLLTAFAPMAPGEPLTGVEVGLDHDPESLIIAITDDRGVVDVPVPQGILIGLLLPAVQKMKVPTVARVQSGRTVLTSVPIQPGGSGRAYFMGRDGRRLSLPIPRGGARVRVTLTEGPPANSGGPRR